MAYRTGEITGEGVPGGQITGLIAVFIICASAGYFVTPKLLSLTKDEPMQEQIVVEEPVHIEQPPIPKEDPLGIPVVQEVMPSVLSGETYKVALTAAAPNGQNVEFILYDSKGEEVQHSLDGVFVGVAPSDSIYRVSIVNTVTGQRCDGIEIGDCVVLKPVVLTPTVEKVSAVKLSSMINSGNYSDNFSKYWIREHAPHCKFRFSGLKQDEIVPDSFADLCDRVNLEGWTCMVSKIEYNDMNQMTAVYIAVKYSE